jgi:hypothetical protein
MDDEQILERGGTEEDIKQYAKEHGADLTEEDVLIEEKEKELKLAYIYRYNQKLGTYTSCGEEIKQSLLDVPKECSSDEKTL